MATHSSILAWENPMDRGAWQATVQGGHKSQTDFATKPPAFLEYVRERGPWLATVHGITESDMTEMTENTVLTHIYTFIWLPG